MNLQCNWLHLIFYKPEALAEILGMRGGEMLFQREGAAHVKGLWDVTVWFVDARTAEEARCNFLQSDLGQIKTLAIWCAVLEVQA